MNNELVWAGLVHPSKGQTHAIAANILYERPAHSEKFGGFTLLRFVHDHARLAVIMDDNRVVGCGTVWPHKEAAEMNLETASELFRKLRIPGTPLVHALYTGPVRVR